MCELEETDNPRRGIKGHVCKISTIKDSRNSGGREESEIREPGFMKLPKRRNKIKLLDEARPSLQPFKGHSFKNLIFQSLL